MLAKDTKHQNLGKFLDGELLCAFFPGFTSVARLQANTYTQVTTISLGALLAPPRPPGRESLFTSI